MVSVFTFCVACYLVLLRPLFSGDNKPDGKDKIKREASALSNSGMGLWTWCMTQPSLKVVFKPFRILYTRVLEYVLFWLRASSKTAGLRSSRWSSGGDFWHARSLPTAVSSHDATTGTSALRTSKRSIRHILTTNIFESLSRMPTTWARRVREGGCGDAFSQRLIPLARTV